MVESRGRAQAENLLRILVSGGVVGVQCAKYDLVSYFPRLS